MRCTCDGYLHALAIIDQGYCIFEAVMSWFKQAAHAVQAGIHAQVYCIDNS
jgi:hypothetical protein